MGGGGWVFEGIKNFTSAVAVAVLWTSNVTFEENGEEEVHGWRAWTFAPQVERRAGGLGKLCIIPPKRGVQCCSGITTFRCGNVDCPFVRVSKACAVVKREYLEGMHG